MATKVVQISNIAPQATRDQMHTLFSFVGRLEDIRLYPSLRDAGMSISSRVCYAKFSNLSSVSTCQHLNNTVFIDRAIIVAPFHSGVVPDEIEGLELVSKANAAKLTGGRQEISLPLHLTNVVENNFILTTDSNQPPHLPPYPPISFSVTTEILEEIRRTVTVHFLDSNISAQQCMEFFSNEAGEVKYFRYCTRPNDSIKYALIEFTEQSSVYAALECNDRILGTSRIKVSHATTSITKPAAKSDEAALKEIEEAMNRVKEAQNLVSATVDPLMGIINSHHSSRHRSRSRSRSRYRERRRHSRKRSRSRRRKSREKKGKKRSRSRENENKRNSESNGNGDVTGVKNGLEEKKRRSRSREPKKRSQSRESKRRSRSRDSKRRSRSRESKRRSRSRESKRRSRSRESKRRSRSRESKRRSRSRESKRRSRSRESKKRSRSRESKKRSRSRESKRRSRSRVLKRRSRSREYKKKRSGSRNRKRRSRSRTRRSSSRHLRSRSPTRRRSRSRDKHSKPESISKKKKKQGHTKEESFKRLEKEGSGKDEEEEKEESNLNTEDMEISNSP